MLLSLPLGLSGADLLVNALQRPGLSLDGQWAYLVDPYDVGLYDYRARAFDRTNPPSGGFAHDQSWDDETRLIEYGFTDDRTLPVPGDWNSQDEQLWYYEGGIWYRKHFQAPEERAGKRFVLYFGGANYQTDVYLNGRKLGTHIGGFTPFQWEVTEHLREGKNSLVVRVDNRRHPEAVPTTSTDWWNYGGITRSVRLVELPETHVADYWVQLDQEQPDRLQVDLRLDGPDAAGKTVTVRLPELGLSQRFTTGQDGRAQGTMPVKGHTLWSPDHPQLYDLVVESPQDRVGERIGLRTIGTEGQSILLNGQPIYLRGVCLHEENPLRSGRSVTIDEARMLLTWAKELGCNFIRLAHYPHQEAVARLADEMGLLLWEEIPVYWTIQWENPDTLANARNQLAELIQRDRNRASVIIWSVANETPPSDARLAFLRTLIDDVRAQDSTRLVSAALEMHPHPDYPGQQVIADPLGEFTDVVSFNQYIAWYGGGDPDNLKNIRWKVLYDKPIIVSEFGAGAEPGRHGPRLNRFTEEYQAWLYEKTLPMLDGIEGVSGLSPWILVDFRSPRRLLPGVQDNWNLKGLIGRDGQRKQAFYVLQDFYEKKAAEAEGKQE
ncbi:MAG: glycoside hydrolase family 2 TIM barrel-domain containing protein [Verrucomicrobiota bacterium JB022]|nr:glycoside hydrolase family 2 TIM barrel-domain containing protein [Verrucomicrobiota bacterium JB022]